MHHTTGSTTQNKKKSIYRRFKKRKRRVLRSHGETNGEAGRDKRAENIAEGRDYRTLEPRHDGAARAREEAVAKYAAETEAR